LEPKKKKKKELKGELMVWRTQVQAKVQGWSFLFFFTIFFAFVGQIL
jgi:hypothetical protein